MSIHVFRAAVLSIVLTLVAGPNASLLCAVWCHPEAAAAAERCEHPDATDTANVTANGSCPDTAAVTPALVREDVRRGISASDGQAAVLVPSFQFVARPTTPEFGGESRQHPPLEARPLVLALRI